MSPPVQISELDGGYLPNDNPSVFSQIEKGLEADPHNIAAICMHQPADHLSNLVPKDSSATEKSADEEGCLTLTYQQVHHTAVRLASGLRESGIKQGDIVLLAIQNGGEYVLLLWTCALLKLTLVALDPSLLDPQNKSQLEQYMRLTPPAVVVAADGQGIGAFEAAARDVPSVQPAINISFTGDHLGMGYLSLCELAARGDKAPYDEQILVHDARNDDPERVHAILFTSGTSGGMPKGCPVRVRSMAHILEAQSWLIHQGNCHRVLQQAHISRAIGPQHTLQTWRCGGTIVMPGGPSFSIDHTVEAILKYQATFIVLSPAMVHALSNMLPHHPGAGESVQSIQIGGDSVGKQVMWKCNATFPNADVFVNHGMSEGGSVFLWPFFNGPIDKIPFWGGLCPTGAVAPGTKVRLWDAERKCVVPRGEAGCLHLLSHSLIRGYLDNRSAESFYEDEEGHWFNTGDVALMNEEGIVYILGRAKDALEQDGKKLMPSVLESVVESFTGRQSTSISLPNRSHRQRPIVVLSDLEDIDKEKVQQKIEDELGQQYVPEKIVSLQDIGLSKFPVNATHKVIKADLETAVLNSRIV